MTRYVSKNLVRLTWEKHIRAGLGKMEAELATANELGLSLRNISVGRYRRYPFEFDLQGYSVDNEWLEGVALVYGHMHDLREKSRFLGRIIGSLQNRHAPVDAESLKLAAELAHQLFKIADSLLPAKLCHDCATNPSSSCPTCGGVGWLPNRATSI